MDDFRNRSSDSRALQHGLSRLEALGSCKLLGTTDADCREKFQHAPAYGGICNALNVEPPEAVFQDGTEFWKTFRKLYKVGSSSTRSAAGFKSQFVLDMVLDLQTTGLDSQQLARYAVTQT